MNRKQNLEVFAKTPVRKAVLLQIVPAVASQMVTLVYNLADTYFVGMLNAPHETAAVTVAYPSYYNKFGQESRAASPAFSPSRA